MDNNKIRKILVVEVVEDEPSMLSVLSDKLNREKYEVIKATNGREGIDIAIREQPDLILLDIVMPEMDGVTMLEKLRQDSWGKNAKVIILSNLSDPEKEQQAKNAGALDYLLKSKYSLDDLVKIIHEKLGDE